MAEKIASLQADVTLNAEGFAAGASKLTTSAKSISKALDNLGSPKLNQTLDSIALKVKNMGGVAALNAPQIAKLRVELDKLAAAGLKIPKSLQLPKVNIPNLGPGLQQQLSSLTAPLGSVGQGLAALGPAGLAAAAGIGAISIGVGAAVSAATQLGSKITDLAAKTGLSTDAVQEFGFAAEQTGSSMEAVAQSTVILQKNIAGGSKVFQQLGLDLANLRSLSPEQQFLAVADAIRKIDDPAKQAQAALQAFGRSGAELLPAIRQGFGDLAAEARNLGLVLDKDAVAAGDRFGDSMDKAGKAWQNLKAQVGGKIIGTLQLDVVLNLLSEVVGASGNVPGGLLNPFGIGQQIAKQREAAQKAAEAAALDKASTRSFAGLGPAATATPSMDAQLKLLGTGLPDATAKARKALSEYDKEQEKTRRNVEAFSEAQKDNRDRFEEVQKAASEQQGKSLFAEQADTQIGKLLGDDTFGSVVKSAQDMEKAVLGVNNALHDGELGIRKVKVATKEVANITHIDWSGALQDIANLAHTLPGVFGEVFGGILSGVAGIGSALKNVGGAKGLFGALTGGGATSLTGKLGNIVGGLGAVGQIAGAAVGIGKSLFDAFTSSPAEKAAKAAGKVLGRKVSEEMGQEIVDRAKATGKSIEAVIKEIKVEELTGKLTDLRGKAQEAVGQIGAGLNFFGKVKGAAAAQGRIFGTQFAAVVKAEGFDKALALFKSTFAGLPDDIKAAIPADIQQLFAFGENVQFAGAIDAASALAESFKGTVALIGLSSQTMADFGEVTKATYDQAIAGALEAGATQEQATNAALQAVIPILSQMQSASIQTGQALDANTQNLLDMAKAAGIEIPVDPLIQVVDILKEIAATLQQIGGITVSPRVNVQTTNTVTSGPTPPAGAIPRIPEDRRFSKGGFIRADRSGELALLHGPELVVPLSPSRRRDAQKLLSRYFDFGAVPGFALGGAAGSSLSGFTAGGAGALSSGPAFSGVSASSSSGGSGSVVNVSLSFGPITVEGGPGAGADLVSQIEEEQPALMAALEPVIRQLQAVSA